MRLFGLSARRSPVIIVPTLACLLSACASASTSPQASIAVEHPTTAGGNAVAAAETAIAAAGKAATATGARRATSSAGKTATPGKVTTTSGKGATIITTAAPEASAVAPGTAAAARATTAPASTVTADGVSGWVQKWSANFNGPANSGVDTGIWTYDVGTGFGDSEIEKVATSTQNTYLDGQGDLNLTAIGSGSNWTSGRIQTNSTFTPPVGGEMLVTASILQPNPANGLGYWPAFWLAGGTTFPENGEIDILEDANGLSMHSGTFACGTDDGTPNSDGTYGACHEPAGLGTGLLSCSDCQQSYNAYSVVIDRRVAGDEHIYWYLNGQEFFTVNESQVGTTAWTEAVDHGFWIILDLAIGGPYPEGKCGCTAPSAQTTSGGTMSVRDLAVYTK